MKYIYPAALAAALLIVAGAAIFMQSGSSTPTATAPVTLPTPVATSTSGSQAPATYTLAQLAEHSSASDCWTAINGSVYNLTPFIPVHPGGDRILAVCGIDGTSLFEAQHGSNQQANAELAKLKIGTLAQ